jgi:hypothetical protein
MLQILSCTVNIINDVFRSLNDNSRSINDDSKVTVQIVASLSCNSKGVIYDRSMCIVQATDETDDCSANTNRV